MFKTHTHSEVKANFNFLTKIPGEHPLCAPAARRLKTSREAKEIFVFPITQEAL